MASTDIPVVNQVVNSRLLVTITAFTWVATSLVILGSISFGANILTVLFTGQFDSGVVIVGTQIAVVMATVAAVSINICVRFAPQVAEDLFPAELVVKLYV